jgi:hypothetical protein
MSFRPPMIPSNVFVIELSYFLAIFLLSLGIYLQTRKLQAFSLHRGIKYFQTAFLSFAIIYLCRLLQLSVQGVSATPVPDWQTMISQISAFFVAFFSFFGIFNLFSSFLWRKHHAITDNKVAMASLLLAAVVFFIKLPLLLLVVGLAAIALLIFEMASRYEHKKKVFSPIFVIYILFLAFFLFDLVPSIQQLTPIPVEIIGYIGSVCVFVYLNFKIKRVFVSGNEEEK